MEYKDTQNNIYIIYKPEEEKVGKELVPSPFALHCAQHSMVKGQELGISQA
jgi:hypothetical protein